MLDHVTVPVTTRASQDLYLAALQPLGWKVHMVLTREQIPDLVTAWTAGLGPQSRPVLWLRQESAPVTAIHVAISATTRAQVDAFHRAALQAGLRDHGAPGLRPHYHPNYYGAFVVDPDGHNLEVVCHAAE
jgi:catechol 2,3-dioxygenase-like lactoylglutathione lyase family enzyme